MLARITHYFETGADKPLMADREEANRQFRARRNRLFIWLIIGYGFFYTCRLSLSVAKAPMLDAHIMSVEQMGVIGSILLYVYAIGKFMNGVLADRANIRRFMSAALLCSAVTNLLFGATSNFYLFAALWALNGWFQSIGSAPSVVSICQWFGQKERGTRYGIWAGAHNLGEGLTFVGTALLVNAFGWRWGFWGPGIACVIVAMFMFRNLGDRPETYGLPGVVANDGETGKKNRSEESIGKLQLAALRRPIVWVLGLSSATMYMTRYGINSWGMLFLQNGKGYELVDAATVMSAYPIFGLLGAVSSGYISDRYFNARRNIPTLIYGLLLPASLIALQLTPPASLYIDAIILGVFGFAIGGLIVFLAGLIAIDLVPDKVVGSVKGIIGLFSYLAAATQDWVSGLLIGSTKDMTSGSAVYDFDGAFAFWIGAAVVSLLLALVAWNSKPEK